MTKTPGASTRAECRNRFLTRSREFCRPFLDEKNANGDIKAMDSSYYGKQFVFVKLIWEFVIVKDSSGYKTYTNTKFVVF